MKVPTTLLLLFAGDRTGSIHRQQVPRPLTQSLMMETSEEKENRLHEFIKRFPKIELHAHLNGCIREQTLSELAAERNVTLPSHHFDVSTTPHSKTSACMLYNTKPRSLRDCFEMFAEIPACVNDIQALRRITYEALEDFEEHNVMYLELRSTPKRLLWTHKNKDTKLATKRDYVETILEVMDSYEQQTNFTKGDRSLPITVRFIVSIDRSGTVEEAMENVKLAIDLFEDSYRHLVGVDLGGNPQKNDFSDFQPALQLAREAGLRVTVHSGELPCYELAESKTPEHIKAYKENEAILNFRPDRVGHALLLPPSLNAKLEKAKIPVECCPTSNVMTLELATHVDGDLVHGLKRHPQLKHWLKTKHPFSVSTDDSGVFNTDSTQELLLLALAWDLDEEDIKLIVRQSIEHVFYDEVKKYLVDVWGSYARDM